MENRSQTYKTIDFLATSRATVAGSWLLLIMSPSWCNFCGLCQSQNIFTNIINALLASNFKVTAVSRPGSAAIYPRGVIVKETNYAPASLRGILIDQDAVVSCIARTESETELRIIDAAEAVGVQRFLPSEYGAGMHGMAIPEYTMMLEGKEKVLKYLKQQARINKRFTWTAMVPGPFFDYVGIVHTFRNSDSDMMFARYVRSKN